MWEAAKWLADQRGVGLDLRLRLVLGALKETLGPHFEVGDKMVGGGAQSRGTPESAGLVRMVMRGDGPPWRRRTVTTNSCREVYFVMPRVQGDERDEQRPRPERGR